jgi:hypothetical protein
MKLVIFGYPKRVYIIGLIFFILLISNLFLDTSILTISYLIVSLFYITYELLPWKYIEIKKSCYVAKIKRNGSSLFELKINGENVARNFWGCQTGYKDFTFDQWKHIRNEPKILHKKSCLIVKNSFFYRNMKVNQEEKFFEKFIIRNYRAKLIRPQDVFDFVVRFSFNPNFIGIVKNNAIKHKNKNQFHRFRNCRNIMLSNKDKLKLEVLNYRISSKIEDLYDFETYLRDQPNLLGWGEKAWDLHARFVSKNSKSVMIPKNSEFFISTKLIIDKNK